MVDADVGDDRDRGVDDVGRVPRAAQPDLDDRDVDREVGEPAERGRGQDLEVRRIEADRLLDERRPRSSMLVELGVGDRLAVDDMRSLTRSRCGLVYAPTERPSVASSAVIIRARRGLAVRAGEVDGRVLELAATRGTAGACAIRSSVGAPARGRRRGTPTPSRGSRARRATPGPSRLAGRLTSSLGRSRARRRRRSSAPASVVEVGDLARVAHVGARRLERGQPLGGVDARRPASTGVVSDRFCSDFALRTSASTSAATCVHERVGAGERAAATASGHAARWIEPVAPPRPHFFGHERHDRREHAQQGRQRDAQRDRGRARPRRRRRRRTRGPSRARRSRRRTTRRSARCVRATARSRTRRTRSVASSTSSASVGEHRPVERLGDLAHDRRCSRVARRCRARTSTR